MSTCVQQWRRCVVAVVNCEAGGTAVITRAEVKVDEMQVHQLENIENVECVFALRV